MVHFFHATLPLQLCAAIFGILPSLSFDIFIICSRIASIFLFAYHLVKGLLLIITIPLPNDSRTIQNSYIITYYVGILKGATIRDSSANSLPIRVEKRCHTSLLFNLILV